MNAIRSSTAPKALTSAPATSTVRKKAYRTGQEFTDQIREIHGAEGEKAPAPPGTGKMIDTSV